LPDGVQVFAAAGSVGAVGGVLAIAGPTDEVNDVELSHGAAAAGELLQADTVEPAAVEQGFGPIAAIPAAPKNPV